MPSFRKKPVIVEARPAVAGEVAHATEGDTTASEGDWIIAGPTGEYVCPGAVFEKNYEPVTLLDPVRSGFDFGFALLMLKQGQRVRRAGWNGNRLQRQFVPPSREPVTYMGLTYILLSDGRVAFCDESDYERVAAHPHWSVTDGGYPYFTDYAGEKPRTVTLHQLLNPEWEMTDHVNGDRLDNRRENLRPCTSAQNNANRAGRDGTSRYKGVSWDSSREKWIASIQVNRKTKHLGRFDDETAAAKAYDKAATEAYGAFARLNFPPPGMWLALTEGTEIPAHTNGPLEPGEPSHLRGAALAYAKAEVVDPIRIGAHIDMRAADGSLVIGWLASQTDMLATDWEVVS